MSMIATSQKAPMRFWPVLSPVSIDPADMRRIDHAIEASGLTKAKWVRRALAAQARRETTRTGAPA